MTGVSIEIVDPTGNKGRGRLMNERDPRSTLELQSTETYYSAAFERHGATALGVDWPTENSQLQRFEALDGLWTDHSDSSLCDLGCGYGAYSDHLRGAGFQGEYLGIDLSDAMIRYAQSEYQSLAGVEFRVGDKPESADLLVGSGIFNVVTSGDRASWAEHVWEMLAQMCEAAEVGVGFNMLLETTVPYRDRDDLFWARPREVCERLESFGHQPRVVTGYGLHEATYLTRTEKYGW
jgi:hypothetical protein